MKKSVIVNFLKRERKLKDELLVEIQSKMKPNIEVKLLNDYGEYDVVIEDIVHEIVPLYPDRNDMINTFILPVSIRMNDNNEVFVKFDDFENTEYMLDNGFGWTVETLYNVRLLLNKSIVKKQMK